MNKKWKKKRTQFFYWKIMITKVYLYDQVLMESMDLLIVIILLRKEEKLWHIILFSDYIAQDHAVTISKWMTNQMMPVFRTSNKKTNQEAEKH